MPPSAIYLDHHATTPCDSRVMVAMLPYFQEKFGNAASINHIFGQEAATAVEWARDSIARLLNVAAKSLVFTSGATESNNLAIKGVLRSAPPGSHLIVDAAEHRAVLDPARRLQREGYKLTILPVSPFGQVDPQHVARALQSDTRLVSVMLANNEVGTLNPIREIGEICRRAGVLLHCDAAQAVGRIPVDLAALPIDLVSISGHKLYAPKGVGVLYVRREGPRIMLDPLQDGGGHEQRLRSGTLPVPLIVGLGVASNLAVGEMPSEMARLRALRDRLWQGLTSQLDGLSLNGHPTERLANNLNFSVAGVDGEALMIGLTGIAVSSGSACTSADPEPSHVLSAMGVSDTLSKASLRFGLGRPNTADDVEYAIAHVVEVVRRLRTKSITS